MIQQLQELLSQLKQGRVWTGIRYNRQLKKADWIIDLGPEGGDKGGDIVFTGTPEEIVNCKKSITGQFLKKKL